MPLFVVKCCERAGDVEVGIYGLNNGFAPGEDPCVGEDEIISREEDPEADCFVCRNPNVHGGTRITVRLHYSPQVYEQLSSRDFYGAYTEGVRFLHRVAMNVASEIAETRNKTCRCAFCS